MTKFLDILPGAIIISLVWFFYIMKKAIDLFNALDEQLKDIQNRLEILEYQQRARDTLYSPVVLSPQQKEELK